MLAAGILPYTDPFFFLSCGGVPGGVLDDGELLLAGGVHGGGCRRRREHM